MIETWNEKLNGFMYAHHGYVRIIELITCLAIVSGVIRHW